MKPSVEQKEKYFSQMAILLVNNYKNRVEKFSKSYEEQRFGKTFFLNIEYRNVLEDLIYYRNQFKQHMSICISNGISKNSFAYQHCSGFYLKQLEDIELKSFISVLRIHNPNFGYSVEVQKKQYEIFCI